LNLKGNGKGKGKDTKCQRVHAFETYLRREMPQIVRSELEKSVDQEFDVVNDKMKTKVVKILEDALTKVSRTFDFLKDNARPDDDAQGKRTPDVPQQTPSPKNVMDTIPQIPFVDILESEDPELYDTVFNFDLGTFMRSPGMSSDPYGVSSYKYTDGHSTTSVADSAYGSVTSGGIYSFSGGVGRIM
jgi:hypothetical protein